MFTRLLKIALSQPVEGGGGWRFTGLSHTRGEIDFWNYFRVIKTSEKWEEKYPRENGARAVYAAVKK